MSESEDAPGTAVAEELIEQSASDATNSADATSPVRASNTSSTRLYVGNLAYRVRWQGLKDHMRQAGNVKHAEVFTDYTGRSKGCGIVEYETLEEAQKAIDELNDTELEGRKIFVREDREQGQGSRPPPASRPDRAQCQLFIGNLDYEMSWQDLKDVFKENGFEPIRADIIADDGYSKGCGTVLLATPEDAQDAISKLDGYEYNGRAMQVRIDRDGQGSRGGPLATARPDRSQCQLFVGNLDYDVSWQDLKDVFKENGFEPIRADILGDDGYSKGCGTVLLATPEDAQEAINKLDGYDYKGRGMQVRLDKFAGRTPGFRGRGRGRGRGRY